MQNRERWEVADNLYALGTTYCNSTEGDRQHNLEQAITYFRRTLDSYTPSASPLKWARTQHALGVVYSELHDDHQSHLKMAIACLQSSMEVYTLESFPVEWAELSMTWV